MTVKVKLTNAADAILAQAGVIGPGQIRSLDVEALVDTGATMLVLPRKVVERLGLPVVREVTVRYADDRIERREVAGFVKAEIMGREALVEALVEDGEQVLVGEVPLEVMDLVVDPRRGTLGPRPESPEEPLIDLL